MNRRLPVSMVLCLAFFGAAAGAVEVSEIFESPVPPKPAGQIDRIVFARLAELKIEPVLCSDTVFVRRAYLDVTGVLPTADEVRAFLADEAADKRDRLIDRLLERSEAADYWAMKWGDILRIKAEIPVNLWPNARRPITAGSGPRWPRTNLTTSSSARCSPPAAATSRWGRSISTAPSRTRRRKEPRLRWP